MKVVLQSAVFDDIVEDYGEGIIDAVLADHAHSLYRTAPVRGDIHHRTERPNPWSGIPDDRYIVTSYAHVREPVQ